MDSVHALSFQWTWTHDLHQAGFLMWDPFAVRQVVNNRHLRATWIFTGRNYEEYSY